MGHPVTTNPFIIMMINMTVVFIVLVALSFLIQLIHKIDPTKEPEVAEPSSTESVEGDEMQRIINHVKDSKTVTHLDVPSEDDDIPEEVIAAIVAAIARCGVTGEIRAVRMIEKNNTAWKSGARSNLGTKNR
ncbi:MAG: OadG family protein [Selenomonadaceae bacterium]|nr:OadG family protein [Selenomonadaceae bacterium]